MPKPPPIGNVNACAAAGRATLFNREGQEVARCYAMPNTIAAAFLLHPTAEFVQTPDGTFFRRQYENRMAGFSNGGFRIEDQKQYIRTR